MADQKISQLPNGGALQASDKIPIARGSGNYSIQGSQFIKQPFTSPFNATSDWLGPISGTYRVIIPAATHGFGTNVSTFTIFQEITGDFFPVNPLASINPSTGDVTIFANETPDSRFAGKISIFN